MAAQSRYLAYQAFIARLKGINGPAGGYWLDIGRRVYPKIVLPEDQAGTKLPYICVPWVDTAPRWEQENDWVVCQWQLLVMGFVSAEGDKIEDDSTLRDVAHLTEDIIRAVFDTQSTNLGGVCQDVKLIDGGDETAAVDSADFYGEFILRFRIQQIFQRSSLGPAGA